MKQNQPGNQHTCVCAQSCPTLCNPMDCNPPSSSVHRILQARILVWVAIPFSSPNFRPEIRIWVHRAYFGVIPGNRREGVVKSAGQEGKASEGWVNGCHCGQMKHGPTRHQMKDCIEHSSDLSSQRKDKGVGIITHQLLAISGWRLLLQGC